MKPKKVFTLIYEPNASVLQKVRAKQWESPVQKARLQIRLLNRRLRPQKNQPETLDIYRKVWYN